MSEWQKIETAPRDNSWLLIFDPSMEMPVAMGTYFRDDIRDSKGRFKAGDWCTIEWDGMPSCAHPTHWMPLPAPPLPGDHP